MWIKSLGQNDGTKHGLAAEYRSKHLAMTMFKFLASLEMNFIRKICTYEAETLVSGLHIT